MLFSEIMAGMRTHEADGIPVLGGGVIPDQDITLLKEMGVREIFTPGASLTAITNYIEDLVPA
jgi:methylmalonyl-CoA mutase C-terminal domain/subunit